jgi:hypothetical protein
VLTEFFAEIIVKATAEDAMKPVHAATSPAASRPSCGTKDHLNAFQHAVEAGDLLIEMTQAGARYLVNPHTAIRRRRNSPISRDQQALKSWVE